MKPQYLTTTNVSVSYSLFCSFIQFLNILVKRIDLCISHKTKLGPGTFQMRAFNHISQRHLFALIPLHLVVY